MEKWSPEEHQAFVDRKRQLRMDAVDRLPQPMRELVQTYGLTVVNAFMDCGVKKPSQIRHLVETVLDEFSPTRGSFSKQGRRAEIIRGGKSL